MALGLGLLAGGCGRYAFDASSGGDGGGGSGGGDTGAGDSGGAGDSSGSGDGSVSAWWDSSWQHRIKLVLSNAGPSLLAFPVMVRLDTTRVTYADAQNQGQDVRFVDADGTTVLPHEIEQWNPNGASYLWVRVPQIDA